MRKGQCQSQLKQVKQELEQEDLLERKVYLDCLYDFYSPLLTDRQRDVYEMLHFSDLGLSEVANALDVTRQAVHILDRRITERLYDIEKKLHFAETVQKLEAEIQELKAKLKI